MKTTAFFDIETNAINDWSRLSDLETIHSMVVIDPNGSIGSAGKTFKTD